ncbi:MAG: hypothetical protein Q7Q73_07510, partial [Verrucomicrobiota bacterium JB024]|nr:hypothetical protein [Verrucomicrobiota bacterium JB024]
MALPTGDTWASAVGTGSSINVALDFVFWESSSIKAFKYTTATGVGAAFTDFTVMGGNGSTGMAITTDNHPTTSETVKFYLEMPLEQQESQNEGTGYSATSIERADDKNAQRIKQLSEEIARCVKVPVNETSADDLPAFASRAGKVPSFDENGKLVATISAAPLADVGDAVATAEAAATTATTQAATATTQAGIATTQAGIATTKAAEAAASAATIGQDVSTSGTPTFAGLALTGNADLNSNKITELGDATADTDALNRQSADARYLRLAQALGDIPDKAAARLNLDVFGRGIVRGRSRTPLAEQPGIEPESPMMPVTLTEAEFEALTEYEPRYYDVLGIGTYFGPKRIAWDTDVYDS